MAKPLSKKQKQALVGRFEELWSPGVMAAGWLIVPFWIIDRQRELGLDAKDVNIILQLLRHWARDGSPPELSRRAMAKKIGLDVSTVRRRLASLEKRGYIAREARFDPERGQRANRYHLDGLIRRAASLAKAADVPQSRVRGARPGRAPKPPDIDLVVGKRQR